MFGDVVVYANSPAGSAPVLDTHRGRPSGSPTRSTSSTCAPSSAHDDRTRTASSSCPTPSSATWSAPPSKIKEKRRAGSARQPAHADARRHVHRLGDRQAAGSLDEPCSRHAGAASRTSCRCRRASRPWERDQHGRPFGRLQHPSLRHAAHRAADRQGHADARPRSTSASAWNIWACGGNSSTRSACGFR